MNTKITLVIIAAFAVVAGAAPLTQLAYAEPSFNAQDDKNNPTFPSTGAGNKPANLNTVENIFEVCANNPQAAHCY